MHEENSIYVGGMAARSVKILGIALDGNNVSDVAVVSGGPVIVTAMILEITEAVSAHNCTMGWVSDPTTGTGVADIAVDGVDIISAAIGDFFYAELDATTPVKAEPGTAIPLAGVSGAAMIVPVGSINFTFSNGNPTSGIGTLYIRYEPMVAGAKVNAG